MSNQRLLTAMTMIAVFLAILFLLPKSYFSWIIGVLIIPAAWEWANLANWQSSFMRFSYTVVTTLLMLLSNYLYSSFLLGIGITWWIIAIMLIINYPKSAVIWNSNHIKSLMGWLVLIPCWVAIDAIRKQPNGSIMILYLFIIVWVNDISAYYIGRFLGNFPLASRISPNKTLQGAIGGLVMIILLSVIFGWLTKMSISQSIIQMIIALIVSIFSIFGDLFESMLKRERGIKDSSNLLPGHGGLLDRIDSLTAAAPVFAICGAMTIFS